MCGLSGELRFDGVPADTAAVGRMAAAMETRGPDGFTFRPAAAAHCSNQFPPELRCPF